MSCVILLVGTVAGVPTEFDGKYVKLYDPTYVHPDGYDGGILEVTSDKCEAMQFPDAGAACAKWMQAYGWREDDGEPNRPLTAWNVSVEEVQI
jgi:hypothetical protein